MKRLVVLAAVIMAALVTPAGAWWPKGHGIIAHGAVRALPPEVPAFFREGGTLVAHLSYDPDVAKNRATPNVRDAEEPEHYLDFELLKDRPFPATRYAFLKLCAEEKLNPREVGLLPYSVTEWTERLAVAFAEHRKWPENPHIRTKCLVYAGFLAHYAGDLCQPLHVTIHHDGRAKPDGSSPRSGIHARTDALIEKLELTPEELAAGQKVEPLEALLPGVLKEVQASRTQIDRVYALEASLPPADGPWTPSPEAAVFGRERGRAGARFLASLYLTAWRKSASVKLPPWLERENTAPSGKR